MSNTVQKEPGNTTPTNNQNNGSRARQALWPIIWTAIGSITGIIALLVVIQTAGCNGLATRHDLKYLQKDIESVRTDLQKDIESVRTDLQKDIESVRTDLQKDIESVRTDLQKDIEANRTDTNRQFDKVDDRLNRIEAKLDKLIETVAILVGKQSAEPKE